MPYTEFHQIYDRFQDICTEVQSLGGGGGGALIKLTRMKLKPTQLL
jgi:hypothetical protein